MVRPTVSRPAGWTLPGVFGPSDQVVGEHRAGEPAGVGVEPPGGQVSEAAFFEVAYSELDGCVTAVLSVGFGGGEFGVGGEGVVPPVGPYCGLVSGYPGSADHQPQGFGRAADERLRDLRQPGFGVVDRLPGLLGDRFDSCFDIGVEGNGYRPAHPQAVQLFDQVIRPEPRVGPHRDLSCGAGAAGAVDGLGNEMSGSLLRRPAPEAGRHDLSGVGPDRYQRVISQLAGVTVGGAGFGFARHFTDRRIHINRHRPGWSGARRPRPAHGLDTPQHHKPTPQPNPNNQKTKRTRRNNTTPSNTRYPQKPQPTNNPKKQPTTQPPRFKKPNLLESQLC